MDVFPTFWRLENRHVIVIGQGEAAMRKLRLLVRPAAQISVFATGPLEDEIAYLAHTGWLSPFTRPSQSQDIREDTVFAIVAMESDAEARHSVAFCRHHRIPVNAVDRTELCDFLIPSIVDRSPVVIGIATGGAAPILARKIRETLEAILPSRLGALAAFSQRFRKAVSATLTTGGSAADFGNLSLKDPSQGMCWTAKRQGD